MQDCEEALTHLKRVNIRAMRKLSKALQLLEQLRHERAFRVTVAPTEG